MRCADREQETKEPQRDSLSWFAQSGSAATKAEILFYAFLLCASGILVEQLDEWAKTTLSALAPLTPHADGVATKLPDAAEWRMAGSKPGAMLAFMSDAYNCSWSDEKLEKIGAAMQAYRGAGRTNGLDPGSGEEQAKPLMLEIIKAQAERALEKMHDPRLALADKLASQNGINAYAINKDAHERTKKVHGTNDAVENKFAIADYVMRTYRKISVFNTGGIIIQRGAHDFDRPLNVKSDRRKRKATPEAQAASAPQPGFFWRVLTKPLRHALVDMVRHELCPALRVARDELQQHDDEKLQRREEAIIRKLNSVVDKYAAALELYDQWRSQGVKSKPELEKALKGKSATEQIAELRRQIEMRTVGCGWRQFETKWGFFADEKQHTIDKLREMLLQDILPHERALRRQKRLPAEAAPPQLTTRVIKELGTVDADALRLEAESLFDVTNLLAKAEDARLDREARGISDSVEAKQQKDAPDFNSQLVGKWLEVCWPYKLEGKTVKIWASGKVKRIADGLQDKASTRAKKILPAGAILWAWDADPAYNEPAGEQWLVLRPAKWNRHVQYAWRFDPCELGMQRQQQRTARRPRVQPDCSDEEYLPTEDELEDDHEHAMSE